MTLFALSLSGAIRMWRQHTDGLFFYTISQIMILILPVIWIGWQGFSATNAIFTAVFLGGYTWNLPWLKSGN
jgi:hypothetical protein